MASPQTSSTRSTAALVFSSARYCSRLNPDVGDGLAIVFDRRMHKESLAWAQTTPPRGALDPRCPSFRCTWKLWRRAIGGQRLRREHFPAKDDFGDVRESLNGYRGVFPKQKQIGALAYFNRSNLMIQAERLRIGKRCGAKDLLGR